MDSNGTTIAKNKRFHFELLLPFLFHPVATFPQVIQKRATWLTPLLVISLLVIARAMLATPAAASMPIDVTPQPGMQGPIPPGKGENLRDFQVISARQQKGDGGGGDGGTPPPDGVTPVETGPGSLGNVVPALGAVAGLWTGWFLLSILVYVGMVISGSNNTFTETLNLTAWASLPLGFRQVVMSIATLSVPSLAAIPAGLSALASSVAGPAGMFLSALLRSLDIYLVWQMILVLVGLRQVSPLAPRRIVGITLGAVALFLVLVAMPGFFSAIFTQLTTPVPVTY